MKLLSKIVLSIRCRKIKSYGKGVWVGKNTTLTGNIYVGSNVVIGPGACFVSTQANLIIHDYVVFGPNVTIYTGDHATDVIGKHIIEVSDEDKRKLDKVYDKDVIIEPGCWIGTKVIILKGVRVGRGSVIGAGAVVTKDVPPYSVYVGTPEVKVFNRFTEKEIEEHERLLAKRGIVYRIK